MKHPESTRGNLVRVILSNAVFIFPVSKGNVSQPFCRKALETTGSPHFLVWADSPNGAKGSDNVALYVFHSTNISFVSL